MIRRAKSGRAPAMPTIAPMLATLSSGLPEHPRDWAFEYKWDGVRAICYVEPGALRLVSRNDIDMAGRYPDLAAEGDAVSAGRRLILDGEIVALDAAGRPSFGLLQRRMHVADPRAIARLVDSVPVALMLFDVLYIDGDLLVDEPYEARRRRLADLKIETHRWHTPPHQVGQGQRLLDAARRMNLEGVVAKRLGSVYRPGARSPDWLKVKIHMRQEVVIGGYLPMKGLGERSLGALLVGYYEDGQLRYAGKVGTGFSDAVRDQLVSALRPMRRRTSPFVNKPRYSEAIFVEPRLIAEVAFTEWTPGGALRHPSFQGLRGDKKPEQVVRETR